MRIRTAIGVLAALAVLCGCTSDPRPSIVIHTGRGPLEVRVEVVDTPDKRQRGLMFRNELDAKGGMLFVFEDERKRSFWMKNTPLPLDIIYIRGDRIIDSIAANTVPYSTKPVPSDGPARFVLEVNAGFAARNGILPGQQVVLPQGIETAILP